MSKSMSGCGAWRYINWRRKFQKMIWWRTSMQDYVRNIGLPFNRNNLCRSLLRFILGLQLTTHGIPRGLVLNSTQTNPRQTGLYYTGLVLPRKYPSHVCFLHCIHTEHPKFVKLKLTTCITSNLQNNYWAIIEIWQNVPKMLQWIIFIIMIDTSLLFQWLGLHAV